MAISSVGVVLSFGSRAEIACHLQDFFSQIKEFPDALVDTLLDFLGVDTASVEIFCYLV